MSIETGLLWVLRLFGALYLVGGIMGARQAWFWARLEPDMQRVTKMLENWDGDNSRYPDADEVDNGRNWWLFAGCVLTAMAGLAMLLGHAASVGLLAAVIVHQLFYFVRQRRRELAAKTPADAEEARPQRSTINGFFGALIMAVLAAWLFHEGALWLTISV